MPLANSSDLQVVILVLNVTLTGTASRLLPLGDVAPGLPQVVQVAACYSLAGSITVPVANLANLLVVLILQVISLRVSLHDVDTRRLKAPRFPLAKVSTARLAVEQTTHTDKRLVLLPSRVLVPSKSIDVAETILLNTLGDHFLNCQNEGLLFAYKSSPLNKHVTTVALVVVIVVLFDQKSDCALAFLG